MQIRTFLIADVRGYTLFTQERGDEVAAKLAGKFADIAREGVEARGGRLLELRGDEALCVFASAREAIRAAVDLQQRFVDETIDEPELPLVTITGSPLAGRWGNGWTVWFLRWHELLDGRATHQAVRAGPDGSSFVAPSTLRPSHAKSPLKTSHPGNANTAAT